MSIFRQALLAGMGVTAAFPAVAATKAQPVVMEEVVVTAGRLVETRAAQNLSYSGPQLVKDWPSGISPTPVKEVVGFTVVNLSIKKELAEVAAYGAFSLRLRIDNLLDKQYAHVRGYPMPGRLCALGLDWEY